MLSPRTKTDSWIDQYIYFTEFLTFNWHRNFDKFITLYNVDFFVVRYELKQIIIHQQKRLWLKNTICNLNILVNFKCITDVEVMTSFQRWITLIFNWLSGVFNKIQPSIFNVGTTSYTCWVTNLIHAWNDYAMLLYLPNVTFTVEQEAVGGDV